MKNVADNLKASFACIKVSLDADSIDLPKQNTRNFDKGAFFVQLSGKVNVPLVDMTLYADVETGSSPEPIRESIQLFNPDEGLYILEYKAENLPEGKPLIGLLIGQAIGGASIDVTCFHITYDYHRNQEDLAGAIQIFNAWSE